MKKKRKILKIFHPDSPTDSDSDSGAKNSKEDCHKRQDISFEQPDSPVRAGKRTTTSLKVWKQTALMDTSPRPKKLDKAKA